MENPFEHFNNIREARKRFMPMVFALLSLFIFVLIISFIVDINNKIKQGRYIVQDIESQNTISVSATGEVYTKPDLAITSFSVLTEKATVDEALKENSEKMNKIIEFVKSQGVSDKDLKTTGLNIYPRYEWKRETLIWPQPEGKRVLIGYEVRQSLQVKIREMEKVGAIIQGATSAGANQIGDLRFTIDNEDEFKNQARKQAIHEAKEKAKELAKQLGVKLVKIKNFSESGIYPRYYSLDVSEAVGKGGGETPTPQIETGENKIEVTVSIIYEIN